MSGAVFEPDPQARRIRLAPAFLAVVVFPVVLIAPHSFAGAAAVSAFAVAALVLLARRARNAKVEIDADGLTIRGVYSTRRLDRRQIAEIAVVPVLKDPGPGVSSVLLILDASGRKLGRLNGPYWAPSTMRAIAATVGAETWVAERPTSFKDLRTRYPKAVGATDLYPVPLAILLMAAVFGLVLAAALLYGFVLAA